MTAQETSNARGLVEKGQPDPDFRRDEDLAPDDFSVDEVLRRLSPEEWFPTLRTDIPLWCF